MTKASDQGTRSKLVGAAIEEIADKGWGGVRTRSIADRAGVNAGLVHYHFGSIEDLLIEGVLHTFADIAQMAVESISAETVATGMDGMLDEIAAIDPDDPRWQVLIEAMLHSSRVPRLAELIGGMLEHGRQAMIGRLATAVEAGELPPNADVEGLALGLMALLDGLGLYAFVDPEYDTARAGRAIVSLITGGSGS